FPASGWRRLLRRVWCIRDGGNSIHRGAEAQTARAVSAASFERSRRRTHNSAPPSGSGNPPDFRAAAGLVTRATGSQRSALQRTFHGAPPWPARGQRFGAQLHGNRSAARSLAYDVRSDRGAAGAGGAPAVCHRTASRRPEISTGIGSSGSRVALGDRRCAAPLRSRKAAVAPRPFGATGGGRVSALRQLSPPDL